MATSKEPVDLRSKNKGGRPSNEERSSAAAIKEEIKLTVADAIRSLHKDLNNGLLTPTEKISVLKTYLPIVMDEDTTSEEDVAFDALADKYLKAEIHIKAVTKRPPSKREDKDEPSGSSAPSKSGK